MEVSSYDALLKCIGSLLGTELILEFHLHTCMNVTVSNIINVIRKLSRIATIGSRIGTFSEQWSKAELIA